jgi:hypothetical protein
MPQHPRPLAMIAEEVEDCEEAMDRAARDDAVTLAEWRAVRQKIRRIGRRVARTDVEQAYGWSVSRNGLASKRSRELLGEVLRFPVIGDGDDGPEPPAAIPA